MLDGIPCNSVGAKGCQNAESVGHGITTSGDYIKLGGNIYPDLKVWSYQNGNVLNYKSNAEGNSLTSVESDIEAKAGNGLYYTGTSSPFNTTYSADSEFGVTNWSSATCNYINENMNSTNVCAKRGMRLPTYSETRTSSSSSYNPCGGTGSTNGVPSHPSGGTWTSTAYSTGLSFYWNWNGTSISYNNYSYGYGVRCVR